MRSHSLACCLAVLFAACASSQGASDLARYQHNAQLYWEGNSLDQALGQIERGLELEPKDYKLLSLKAMVRLRQSSGTAAGTPNGVRQLDEAEKLFAAVYATRDPERHERQVLLGYGMALQSQGMHGIDQARALQTRATGASSDPAADKKRADELESAGRAKLDQARTMFEQLQKRGELPRLASYHLLQVAVAQGDHEALIKHAKAYLEASQKDQKWQQDEITRTVTAAYERERRDALQQLRIEEIDVRELLANIHRNRKEYDLAVTNLDRVLEADPSRWPLYFERGQCLLLLNRDADAKADFRRFLATSTLPASHPKMLEAVQALGTR